LGAVFSENPPGGGSFARGRRWLGRYSPLRGCSDLAVLATAKIPRRITHRSFQTGSLAVLTPRVEISNLPIEPKLTPCDAEGGSVGFAIWHGAHLESKPENKKAGQWFTEIQRSRKRDLLP